MRTRAGGAFPLGARFDGAGTNFAVCSEVAEAIELCLFDPDGSETRVPLPATTGSSFHGYLPGVGPGALYGYRVHGPWRPEAGLRSNPSKLLLDPYALEISGDLTWDPAVFPYIYGGDPETADDRDSARFVPRSVVATTWFDWGNDRSPDTPLADSVIYELHVKGFTARHPDVPPELRGTYAGLAHPAVVDYLRGLGVTAVELMPIHQFVHEHALVRRGLSNYWGYNTVGFFAPHNAYSAWRGQRSVVAEFKEMVRTLHAADLEVVLDVVYNHTGEGDHLGPMLCFKGLDNRAFYRLDPDDPARYTNLTGTGNTVDAAHPNTLRLIMDSLRYWVTEMHVDGFRFDLAPALARNSHDFDARSAFLAAVHQDPVLARVKLIAEPWDIGPNGYQLGRFSTPWAEWNDRFRDTSRDYWRATGHKVAAMADCFAGSASVYHVRHRGPAASVNYVTSHDGFTVADLVSYDHPHNEANGEDGLGDQRSWNCGAEGRSDARGVVSLRAHQRRNLLTTTLLALGVPMLLAGDEMGRTQQGNSNAYCQDNEISWVNWDELDRALVEYTRFVIRLRREHPVFRRRRFFTGRHDGSAGPGDIGWFTPDGREMGPDDWQAPTTDALGIALNGADLPQAAPDGGARWHTGDAPWRADDNFLLLLNPTPERLAWRLPGPQWGRRWERLLDSSGAPHAGRRHSGAPVPVKAHSLVVLRSLDR